MNETAGYHRIPGNITGNGNRQRIVSGREIEKFMDRGYEVFTTLPSGKVVMKLPSCISFYKNNPYTSFIHELMN